MNVKTIDSQDLSTQTCPENQQSSSSTLLVEVLWSELRDRTGINSSRSQAVIKRIVAEVERICQKSDRIQASGEVAAWQMSLGRHRLEKCLHYYQLGSLRGRKELQSNLSVIVYRHISQDKGQLSFSARYNLIEDFLQDFYLEVIKAFRREHELPETYQPRTQLELAEYMAFCEQYAKRQINLFRGYSQQLIVLRAQSFAKRQPGETSVDIEAAVETPKTEEGQIHAKSVLMQQLRAHLVSEAVDPTESVLRDRVIAELVKYLESQGQSDCIDYLVLKLEDLSASEIDQILGLTPRQRDYLQQRFKYHVEKFALAANWQLVHQWLGADLDQRMGLWGDRWQEFQQQLSPEQQKLLALKQAHYTDSQISKTLGLSAKQLQKRWTAILSLASQYRNQ